LAKIHNHSKQQELVRNAILARREKEQAEKEATEAAKVAAALETQALKKKEEERLKAEYAKTEERLRQEAKAKLDALDLTQIDETWDEKKNRT
jgi:hypothetical protein